MNWKRLRPFVACTLVPLFGCHAWYLGDADREVATLIESRQQAALGITFDAAVRQESGTVAQRQDMHSFTPSPVDSTVPEAFRKQADDPDQETADDQVKSSPADQPVDARPLTLSVALTYAMHNSRRYQTEKELLFLTALDLTLERHLWTPIFVDSVLSLDTVNFGQISDFDRSMTAVSRFAVEQQLPYGGEVTARVINSWLRDLRFGTTTDESGELSIEARLPLLRGAGKVAYETRYQAERNLIYSVKTFERFRRSFLVDIASDYFNLLSLKAQIESAQAQATSIAETYRRDQALADAERIIKIEADRTRVSMLGARNDVINTIERYETTLDAFKIRIGMPIDEKIDVVEEEVHLVDPQVPLQVAIETALKYRLDLLNARDRLDDERRAVAIARNNLLPRFDVTGSVTMDTDPARPESLSYNIERTTYRAAVDFEIPLERKRERNDYRRSLIQLRRAIRDFDEQEDIVRLEIRRALRRLAQAQATLEIQAEQIRINETRAQMARVKLDAGELPSNRDVVEAEDDLRDARNAHADALSDYRRAVLEFLRDTGTLRLDDDGKWMSYDPITGQPLNADAETQEDGEPGP